MALPRPELIQAFLEEKQRRFELEKQPLLSDDSFTSDYEKYNRLKPKNEKKKLSRRSKKSIKCKNLCEKFSEKSQQSANSDCESGLKKTDSNDSDFKRTNSSLSLKSDQDSKDSKNSSTNYGGTSKVELHCAEVLASYGIIQNAVGANGQTLSLSGDSQETDVYQSSCNGYDFTQNLLKTKENFRESEKYIKDDMYSYYQRNKKERRSSSSPESPRSRKTSFGFESDHCHDSLNEKASKDKEKRQKAMKKLLIATCLSFCFMVGEIVGGYLANSLAIMTDASHLLTDVSSFMISILALKMASRPASKKMTFGWHRAEVIGALISVLTIWIVTGVLVYLAIKRLITNQFRVEGKNMLVTAGLAVGFNILMGLVLHEHGHGHGHSHGHSHDHEAGSCASHSKDSGKSGNVNVRAAFIHVIGDLLQSLGVLTAAFIIYFKPEYKIADPICTFLFSIFVLITTVTILRDTVVIIMEGSPVNIKYNVVKEKLLEIEEIIGIHDLRLWSLTLNQTVMTAHLVINKLSDPNAILKRATRRLKSLYEFHSLTLQVEYYSDDMDSCKKCRAA